MARLCGASKYLECSNLTPRGAFDDVFEAATRAAFWLFMGTGLEVGAAQSNDLLTNGQLYVQ
jgi:hypothetical protein